MASVVLTDAKIYYEELDLSGAENTISLEYEAEALDDTVFGDDTRSFIGGLKSLSCVGSGFVDLTDDSFDERLFSEIGSDGEVMSIVAEGETEGNVGYTFQPMPPRYDTNYEIGQILAFEFEASNRGAKLVRTTMLGQETAAAASGQSTSRQLGAVLAGQFVFAAIHVLSVSGSSPTLDVLVRSDDNSGMSTPTTRITFTQATAATSQFLTAAGAITDDWWDIDFTIGGSTPVFRFVVMVGIA